MRKKLLAVFICCLVATLFVSCGKTDVSQKNDSESVLSIVEGTANESVPPPKGEEKKTINLEENETFKTKKPQKHNEDIEANNGDVLDNSAKPEEIKKDILECTLLVRCDTVLENTTELDKEKIEIIPEDGIIFPETKAIFYEGESVFNVLTRELKKKGIHIDFVNTPMYNTVYIRGISNLYERDCGELSGWIYMVNGKVPSYGCSQYILDDEDIIEFVYTCDLGNDINL